MESSASLLAGVITGCIILSGCSESKREGQDQKVVRTEETQHSRPGNVKEITARFYGWNDDEQVTFHIPAVAVKIPWRQRLQQATRLKEEPWVVIGMLNLRYEDGSEEWMTLFSPMGRVKRGEECWLLDLHELKDYVSDRCKRLLDEMKYKAR
jgi:hypothetical protein